MRALLPHPRAGLTLLELLVVIAILAITATVVPLAWRTPRATTDSAVDRLTQSARREAIRRGEELRLRVDADGAWALAARAGTDIIETGRIAELPQRLSLRVDALGTCRPDTDTDTDAAYGGRSFDVLGCRYVTTAAAPALTANTTSGPTR